MKYIIALLAPLLFAPQPALHAAAAPKQPNVIVFYTDDQGYADLGCQGVVKDIKTPRIDALAKSGARMLHGYTTAPQCVPSRAGLLSGRFQGKFGVDSNQSKLDGFNAQKLLPERLSAAGYATAMYGKWHLGKTTAITRHGFKHVFAQSGDSPFDANIGLDARDRRLSPLKNEDYHIIACSRAASATIERYATQPFFLYVAYKAPHVPLAVPKQYLDRFPGAMPERRRRALAMLSAVDDGVGMVLDTLDKHQLRNNTLIFYISDNGAPLKIRKKDEPGIGPGWDGSLNEPLNGEKGMLAEGGMHVPFVVSWPGTIPAGQVYPHPVSTLDVAATAIAQAGVKAPARELDGVDLTPYLSGKLTTAPHRQLTWRWETQSAIREGNWKFLKGGQREYLYDLGNDLHEKHNLIASHPKVAQRLKQQLAEWSQSLVPPGIEVKSRSGSWEGFFDYYLDGKPAPDAKSLDEDATPKKPRQQ